MGILDASTKIGKKNSHKNGNYRLRPEIYGMTPLNFEQLSVYYKYLREEVTRENDILVGRISSMLTFQGFLVSGVGLVMTGNWMPTDHAAASNALVSFREGLLFLFGFVGLFMAFGSARGIRAACRALDVTKDEWEEVLDLYHKTNPEETITIQDYSDPDTRRLSLYPRTYGIRSDPGGQYGNFSPYAFMAIWILYFGICSKYFFFGIGAFMFK